MTAYLERRKQQKTDNMEATKKLFKSGKNDTQIARDLGVSRHTVSNYRLELGLNRPRYRARKAFKLDMTDLRRFAICHPWRLN